MRGRARRRPSPSTASGPSRASTCSPRAPGWRPPTGFRCASSGRRRSLGSGRRRRDRGRPDHGVDRQRGGSGPRGAGEEGGLGRARRRATSPRAARRRWSAPARPGRRWPPPPSGCAGCKGVQRPALAVQLPVPGKPVLFLDVGANVEVRAQHLVQFAFLGAAFSEAVLGVERPRVGLLSVGEEAGKGTRGGRRGPRACSPAPRGSTSSATSRAATCPPAPPTSSSPTASPATSR